MENETNFLAIYESAKKWTLEAGEKLTLSLKAALEINYKTSAADLVTHMDREIEQFFIEKIKITYPTHVVLGEEGIAKGRSFDPKQEIVWIVDPIDGTTNFVHQKRNFSISVGVYDKGKAMIGLIYDPIENALFHAYANHGAYLNTEKLTPIEGGTIEEGVISFNHLWLTPNDKVDYRKLQKLVQDVRGVRSVGSAALEMAYVACGRLDAYLDFRLSPWDVAAGLVILSEVGAISTTFDNQPIDVFHKTSTFIAKPNLHKEMIQYFHSLD